jgi:hypothetical protein
LLKIAEKDIKVPSIVKNMDNIKIMELSEDCEDSMPHNKSRKIPIRVTWMPNKISICPFLITFKSNIVTAKLIIKEMISIGGRVTTICFPPI